MSMIIAKIPPATTGIMNEGHLSGSKQLGNCKPFIAMKGLQFPSCSRKGFHRLSCRRVYVVTSGRLVDVFVFPHRKGSLMKRSRTCRLRCIFHPVQRC